MIDLLTWLIQLPTILFLLVFIIFIFLFIFMAMRTPMITFFRASIRGKIIAAVYRRDRRISFIGVDLKNGAIDDRKYGLFTIPEDSVYNESKSGIPIVLLHTDVATGIPPLLAQATQRLHELGIPDMHHAEFLDKTYHKCNACGHDGIVDYTEEKNPENNKIIIDNFKCHKCKSVNLTRTGLKIDIDNKRSISLGRIKDYLAQINPIFIRSIKERDVDDERQDLKDFIGGNAKLMGIAMFIIILVVALIIFLSFLNSQPDPATIAQQCADIWRISQNVPSV